MHAQLMLQIGALKHLIKLDVDKEIPVDKYRIAAHANALGTFYTDKTLELLLQHSKELLS